MTKLVLEFKNIESDDKTKYDTFYLNSKTEAIINERDICDVLKPIYSTTRSNMKKSLRKGQAGLFIQS